MAGSDALRAGYHDLLRPEVLALVPATARRILDLGCGTGALGKALKARQSCHVDGIEINKAAALVARDNLDTVHEDNLNRFDPSYLTKKYDCIIFADILEHLISPWDAIKKYTSVLEDSGVVVASIPNIAHPWILSNLAQGLFRYAPAGLLDITHLRFFTKTSIFQLFYGAGLKIVNIRPHPSADNPSQFLVTATRPMVPFPHPVATILILTHNNWPYTKSCLDSIKYHTHAPYKILVIDNGSTDGTVEHLRQDTSLYHIENSCNLGFSKGNNIGLMLVDTPYFVLCNNDVVVTPHWLSRMIKHIDTDWQLMVLGPRTNSISGPQVVSDTPYTDTTSLEAFASRLRLHTTSQLTYFQRIVFFFTLFKSAVLPRVGLLDEIYGMGTFEDDDYCMRVIKMGFKCAFDNTVFIHHYGSQSFRSDAAGWRALLAHNQAVFLQKWALSDITDYYRLLRT